MGSGRTRLCLLACLALSSLSSLAEDPPLRVMSAPNLLRVGTAENIFVACQDCTGGDMRVDINVMNHPTKTNRLATTFVTLNTANKFQDLGKIFIPTRGFSKDPNMKQYVVLQAQFPDVSLEKVVLVSFQSGYIFIQTDKTLYTPNSRVQYRVFAIKPSMEPVELAEGTDASVITEIVTPNGIILSSERKSLQSGIYPGHYQLGEIVSTGLWKVVARFADNPQESFSAEFEVKEYVLPSFEVKLTSARPFFHVNSSDLTIDIKARYLFGEEVTGDAYVVFGVVHEGQKKSFPASLQRVSIKDGQGVGTLKRAHITETFPNIHELVGSSIFVAVSVLTESGGEMVEAELRGIQIVTSPYNIHFRKTPKYFKPGMSFDVVVEVVNPDGTPAKSVAVVVEPDKVAGVTKENGLAKLTINTEMKIEPLTITANTNAPGVTQATATMTAHPYTTSSKSYIYIGVDSTEVKVGDNLKITINLNNHENAKHDVTFLILSRGQLVKHGRYGPRPLTAATVTVTNDMLPSFRIIAFYHTKENEVVSDSVWADVKGSCMGSLKLEASTRPPYEPANRFVLKVKGDPGATVGLVAVDKGVYVLNNQHRLTQKKIWDIVDKYDPGCTPGGGRDAMSVFYDAGLLFQSNVASGSPYRQEIKCPGSSRRKRASTILDVKTSLVSQYKEKKERDCCLSGMRDTPLSYNCERRSEYIVDGAACVEAFLHCCRELANQRTENKQDSLLLARSEEEENSYMDSTDIVSRTQFPESWMWTNLVLPLCSDGTTNCDTTVGEYKERLKDSITTWQLTAISLSRTHSICVADPFEIIVKKPFFIDLRLPYSAVRGEQLEIKAILHNYHGDSATVRVELIENNRLCSSASRRGKYRQEVTVGAGSTRSVPFIIIPMKEGQFDVEVKAAVKGSSSLNDGIRKKLLVVPEGVLTKSLKSITLDPVKKGVGGKQELRMNSEIPESDLVPNTPSVTQIFVTGREQLSALVENAISGTSMGTLIKEPSGCGEQNMISMTLPLIATMYLDKTNQWEKVGFEKRKEAIQHIRTGYQNELAFNKNDGSFAVFPKYDGSTWLTAYVAKVFAMAYELVAVDTKVICKAVRFLTTAQQPDGMFRDIGTIIHGEMIGDVRGTDSHVSMTAFCLIAMQETRTICNDTGLEDRIKKAVEYLEKHLYSLTSPYSAAISSYALANENRLNKQILSRFISQELNHVPVPSSHLFTLEATAYALLALVKAKAFEDARPFVRWFNQQQTDGGGYGSTQATIMVYQAIAEYWVSAKEPEYDVNVDLVLPDRTGVEKINFNRETHYTTKTSKINYINKDVKVIATGTGEATVKMVSLYYALPKEKESNCQKFDMTVQLIPEKIEEDKKTYKLKIDILYKDTERDATMSILDIGLLTGYTVDTDDLNLLSKGHDRTISNYEMNKVLSERGSLIIYLKSVSHRRSEEIAFRIHQTLKVGVLQPAAVTVYEYYDHQHNNQTQCVKFYHPNRRDGELLRLCSGNECSCAEENCSKQNKEKISNEARTQKACESERDMKIDFVYKVRVENFTADLSTDVYTMRVEKVIKEGTDACELQEGKDSRIEKNCDVAPEGKLRTFLSYPHCRVDLNLTLGKAYLIMGLTRDVKRNEEMKSYVYMLGERTWIEYWPTDEECQAKTNGRQAREHNPIRATCLGLEELVDTLTIFGCQQK
ncbi:complement C3-like [Anabas testudineus]|uniref:Complement component c3a, duplicate 5 n=1 Tax=Anabas testudineus TaxID=64144 RepID=A0A3Q1JVJ4_ANATE|nr:complement C3-like [Anabas testudineus]